MNIQNISNEIYGTKNLNEGEYAKYFSQSIDDKIIKSNSYFEFTDFNKIPGQIENKIKF